MHLWYCFSGIVPHFPSRDHYVSTVSVCRWLQYTSATLIYQYTPATSINQRGMGGALQSNIKNRSPSNIYYYASTEIAKFCCDQSIHHQLKPHYTQSWAQSSILSPSYTPRPPTSQTTQNRHMELSITAGAKLRTPCCEAPISCAKRPPQYPWQQE